MHADPVETSAYAAALIAHCQPFWGTPLQKTWSRGPVHDLPREFHVLQFPPKSAGHKWITTTCGMSLGQQGEAIELFLRSDAGSDELIELLYVVAHYHRTGSRLGLHHTVNFGRGWASGSLCTHGFISLPYIDGPALERHKGTIGPVRILWLVPITPAERAFAMASGVEALEREFEKKRFDYSNPARRSVV